MGFLEYIVTICISMGVEDGRKTSGTSAFSRRTDKRLVKQMVLPNHAPSNWVPMDLNMVECKLMEVRKYSADYHELDTKFRKPNFELITAYTIQNPFLLGCYTLRKEHMKMQIEPEIKVKEKLFYYPTTFEKLEDIIRHGLQSKVGENGITFYPSSTDANREINNKTNPRVLVVTRVLLGICQLRPDDNQLHNVFTMEKGLRRKVDSFTNEDKLYFIKTNINEIYPETILIYRDKNGPSDQRGSRVMELSKRGVVISYRSGTRYNPDEQMIEAITDQSADSKLSKDNSKRMKRKENKPGSKKERKTKENIDPEMGSNIGEKSKLPDLDTETLKVLVEKHSEGKSTLSSELQIVSEDGKSNDEKKRQNININVDEYADTGAIPKRSSEN